MCRGRAAESNPPRTQMLGLQILLTLAGAAITGSIARSWGSDWGSLSIAMLGAMMGYGTAKEIERYVDSYRRNSLLVFAENEAYFNNMQWIIGLPQETQPR